jgi:hypothetical protein
MDDDSDAEGGANKIAFSNKDNDKGPATLLPVHPTTPFNDNRIPVSHWMERDAASISDGIWPGSHNIILLTCFIACHHAGDWNSYLFFTQGVDSQLPKSSLSSIQVNNWCSLQSNGRDSSVPPSSVAAVGALGGRPAVGPKDLGGNSLGHNLCNKTDDDSAECLPFIGLGTVVTAILHCAPPRIVSLVKPSYGHPGICIRFLTICACTPAKVAAV